MWGISRKTSDRGYVWASGIFRDSVNGAWGEWVTASKDSKELRGSARKRGQKGQGEVIDAESGRTSL